MKSAAEISISSSGKLRQAAKMRAYWLSSNFSPNEENLPVNPIKPSLNISPATDAM
jgi:hypothetical protein